MSFISRAMATPSAPGTRSGPGPVLDSACMVMPASSMALSRCSPRSGRRSIGLGRPTGGLRGRKPRALMAAGSMRLTNAGTVKCSSIATTRMGFLSDYSVYCPLRRRRHKPALSLVQAVERMQRAHREVGLRGVDQHRKLDLGCGDGEDVDLLPRQRLEGARRDAGVAPH